MSHTSVSKPNGLQPMGVAAVVLPNVIQLLDKSLVESCNVDMHSKLIPADTHKTSLEMILDADANIMTSMPNFRFSSIHMIRQSRRLWGNAGPFLRSMYGKVWVKPSYGNLWYFGAMEESALKQKVHVGTLVPQFRYMPACELVQVQVCWYKGQRHKTTTVKHHGPDNQGLFPCLPALQKGSHFEQTPQSLDLLKVPCKKISDLTDD